MPVQIRLKRKYLVGHKSRFQGGERAAPRKKRNKLGYDKHIALFGEPKKITLLVNGRTGKGVFVEV